MDRHARITVRNVQYSVPARLIGRPVRVRLSASDLVVVDGKTVVAQHERSTVKGGQVFVLDHYLEVLVRKPGALPGATALAQARARGLFTPAHEAFWAAARKKLGDRDGTRELIEVLLLHRHLAHDQVVAGLTAAVSVGAINADVVAVEARRHATELDAQGGATSSRHHVHQDDFVDAHHGQNDTDATPRVVSLTERRLTDPAAGLPADSRPLPTVTQYDQLLRRATGTDATAQAATTTPEEDR